MFKLIRTSLLILLLAILALVAIHVGRPWWRYLACRDDMRRIAGQNKVNSNLVFALIWQESRFDSRRQGRVGEIGLMQVNSDAFWEWARSQKIARPDKSHLFDPQTNMLVGTWYLGRALQRWAKQDDPVPYALAEYNAGLSNARRWAALPGGNTATGFVAVVTYPTTRRYIQDIQARTRWGF